MPAAPPRVVVHGAPRAFLDRARPWLLRAEAEYSLMLGIAAGLAASDRPAPALLATVEDESGVVGAALRTPPHKLVLTRMPPAALPLVADAAEPFGDLPAVLGPPDLAEAFGRVWAGRHGVHARPGMRQRVFELTRLVPPNRPAAGRARPAQPDDVGTVAAWLGAFDAETGAAPSDARALAERWVAAGDVWLWDEGGAAAMAAVVARSPHGARVGAVYTPAPLRGRGYATGVVAALSRHLLGGGARFCSLYTDLANPTSNAIYRRLGYAPVADALDVEFGP
ncbi:GNAT family N-acetyltransferase [Rubrivirga sp. S365]|uniref:GNAT family N-acetyltransferase n=1 Tax=Rubrivirga litoralis TaxID=3075598 RepID=A0ABU3BM97_9BACT|nr:MULTISPECIES: GNAT family N-acetyltransferase [unclassified Rubrivirga]MDT0630420.1 GNAT family N-acetyltransferase [Rubrivirga sp. F394]MDT7857601.1 GNAT family N-acetyltransferase [Rubrivirga sp. S365]